VLEAHAAAGTADEGNQAVEAALIPVGQAQDSRILAKEGDELHPATAGIVPDAIAAVHQVARNRLEAFFTPSPCWLLSSCEVLTPPVRRLGDDCTQSLAPVKHSSTDELM
jgi:hypothetical protein